MNNVIGEAAARPSLPPVEGKEGQSSVLHLNCSRTLFDVSHLISDARYKIKLNPSVHVAYDNIYAALYELYLKETCFNYSKAVILLKTRCVCRVNYCHLLPLAYQSLFLRV